MPALALGAGRSGSLFLNSADGKFLFKTITKDDMATLRLILRDYTTYVCTQPSRLMKFVGLHRFRFAKTGETRYVVVAMNIFNIPRPLAEQGLAVTAKFDLKGRKPKKAPELRPLEPNRGVFKDNQVRHIRMYIITKTKTYAISCMLPLACQVFVSKCVPIVLISLLLCVLLLVFLF